MNLFKFIYHIVNRYLTISYLIMIIGLFLVLVIMSYDIYMSISRDLEVLTKSVIESDFRLLNHYESNIDKIIVPFFYSTSIDDNFLKSMTSIIEIIKIALNEYSIDMEMYVKYIDYALIDSKGNVYTDFSSVLAPLNLSSYILEKIKDIQIGEIRSFNIFSWNVINGEKLFERYYFYRLSEDKFAVLRVFLSAGPIKKSLEVLLDNLDISYTSFISLIDIYDVQNKRLFLSMKRKVDEYILSEINSSKDLKKVRLIRFPYIYTALPVEVGCENKGGILYLIMEFNISTIVLRFIAVFMVIILSIAMIFYGLRGSISSFVKHMTDCINTLIEKIEDFKETKIFDVNEKELCRDDMASIKEIKALLDNFSEMASEITSFIEEMKDLNKFLGKTIVELEEKNREIERIHITFSQKLAMIAEGYDENTGNHIFRVGELSAFLARRLGMDDEFVKNIRYYAQLHDIGKIMIPREILNKPGKLTEEEFEEMKKHTIYGAQILSGIEKFEMAYNIALYHHEKYNGTGYPFGLVGDEIPIEAQIVAIVDVYDALRSERSYKKAFSHEKAVEIITKGDRRTSPEEFNPILIEIFLKFEKEIKNLWEEVNNKESNRKEEKDVTS